jgi:two-component system NtrC family sensor kinase
MDEKIRILFVDDEKNVLKSLQRSFLDEEYEILTADSGREGLDTLLEVFPIQVVISDYRMPGMNGVEFLMEVFDRWPETVRMVLSGYADTASIVSAINDGHIYKFIPKPWNEDELKVTVINALEKYFTHKRNQELAEELKCKNEELRRTNEQLNRLIDEKSSEISLRTEIISTVHHINYSIPVGVVGIDPEGIIVQCNKEAEMLLSTENHPCFLGNHYNESLPAEICGFIDGIRDRESVSKRFAISGVDVKLTIGFMNNGCQMGKILVLDRDH